jgi:DNA-directed RNA polymerase III subunit RPC1
VKGRIEKTTLGEITQYIKEVYKENDVYLSVRLDLAAIDALQVLFYSSSCFFYAHTLS